MTAAIDSLVLLLDRTHATGGFACGTKELDAHLKHEALAQSQSGRSTTLVAVDPKHPREVLGFATVAPCLLDLSLAPLAALDRYWQVEVPAVRVTHFAVSLALQRLGLGTALLFAVAKRCLAVASEGKAWLMVIEVPTERSRATLKRCFGALALEATGSTLVVPLATVLEATLRV
jgi:GNAT superfamily N-acetyltransferase